MAACALLALPVLAAAGGAADRSGSLLEPSVVLPVPAARPPKLFNLGLPRTGTTSLHECVQQLGLRSLHANHNNTIETLYPAAYEAFASGQDSPKISALLAENDAFGDLPWFGLHSALLSNYGKNASSPAVFVATTRNLTQWLPSFRWHVMRWVWPKTGGQGYFRSVFGDDIFTDDAQQRAKSAETSDLDLLLSRRFHAHYAALHREAKKAGVELHILDLDARDAHTIDEKLVALLGGASALKPERPGALCDAYDRDRIDEARLSRAWMMD